MNAELGTLQVILSAVTSELERGLKSAEKSLKATGKAFQQHGRTMSLALTTPITLGAGQAVKMYSDFDRAMTESASVMTGLSEETREEMARTARQLSLESTQSATGLAKAYYFLASAGLSAEQSMASLSTVANFATAGAFDLEKATSFLADAQASLGLTSKNAAQNQEGMARVADVLVKANLIANASTEEFAEALKNKAGGAMKGLKKDVEEGVAVLAALSKQTKGLAAGEAFSILSRDIQRAGIEAGGQWEKLGISVFESSGQMRNFADIIEDVERVLEPLGSKQRAITAERLGFTIESWPVLQALIGSSGQIREYEAALRDASGVTGDVANKQLTSFASQMIIVWNHITNLGIEIGERLAPALKTLGEYIKAATIWWIGLSDGAKDLTIWLGVAVVTLGPLLIALGLLISLAGSVLGVLGGLVSMVLMIPAAPILAVVAALGLLLGAALAVTAWWIGPKGLLQLWEQTKTATANAVPFMIGFLANFSENVGILIAWIRANSGALLSDVQQLIGLWVRNGIHNVGVLVLTAMRLGRAFQGWFNRTMKQMLTVDFVNRMNQGLVAALVLVFKWSQRVQRWVFDALLGKKVSFDGVAEEFRKLMKTGNGELDFSTEVDQILRDGLSQMKTSFQGFKSAVMNGPQFKLDYTKPDEKKPGVEKPGGVKFKTWYWDYDRTLAANMPKGAKDPRTWYKRGIDENGADASEYTGEQIMLLNSIAEELKLQSAEQKKRRDITLK